MSQGYTTSAAFLPNEQDITQGIIEIQVVEVKIEAIEIQGLKRLHPHYIQQRLHWANTTPVNVKKVEESLRLLQFNPLIHKIYRELTPGSSLGLIDPK